MPNPFVGLFGRSASTPEAETDHNAQLEAAAEIGGKIATLEADKTALASQVASLQASLDTANTSLTAAVDVLQAEAKAAAVIAYGPKSAATEAEHALIATETNPAKLSALIARYRAATPASLGAEGAGKRETQQAQITTPSAEDRSAKLKAARADEEAKQAKENSRSAKGAK